MASRTSETGVVNRGTSGGDSYYVTDVTTLAGGGVRSETYRTDGAGNNRVLVRTIDVSNLGEITKNETSSNATIDEQRDFLNKGSTLNRLVKSQVKEVRSDLRVEVDSSGANVNVISDQIFEIAAGGSGNTSIETGEEYGNLPGEDDSGDANDGGGSLPQVVFNPVEDQFGVTDNRKTEYENLFYPEDISTSRQDRIRFTMFYQSGRSFNFNLNAEGADDLFTFGKRNTKTINGSVTLPIQGGISDTNAVQYSDNELSPIQAAGAGIILNPNEAFQSASQLFQGGAEAFQNMLSSPEVQSIVNALKVSLAGTAVGANLTARTTGAILNPNLELLLNKPLLREFEFKFRMSARDRKEASQIRKIIRFFKMGMSVKKSNTSLFIVSPNQFRIQYLAGGEGNISKDHPSIGKIKECALTSLNTNYTPDNTYMTFDDEARTMTSYEITMRFKELTPLTESDYLETAAREDSIGY